VGRYTCLPSMSSLRTTYLLLQFEGGLTNIMVEHRESPQLPLFLLFCSLGTRHSVVGRYVCPP
jgi:hypothetical protein